MVGYYPYPNTQIPNMDVLQQCFFKSFRIQLSRIVVIQYIWFVSRSLHSLQDMIYCNMGSCTVIGLVFGNELEIYCWYFCVFMSRFVRRGWFIGRPIFQPSSWFTSSCLPAHIFCVSRCRLLAYITSAAGVWYRVYQLSYLNVTHRTTSFNMINQPHFKTGSPQLHKEN